MELLRSQLERRKLQSDQQGTRSLEIIGLKQKKHSDENLQSLMTL